MSGEIKYNVISVRQGDSFIINIELKNGCNPVNLEGAELRMDVRKNKNLIFSAVGVKVDVEKGKMAIVLTPEQTNNEVGEYDCDIQLTTADGSINTIYPANVNQIGTFRITEQVTQGV